MSKIYWDKIRFLVANICNYQCRFCHNEGQSKEIPSHQFMPYADIKILIDYIKDQGISELCFSGGEPFFFFFLVRMIRYADENTECDISCATNLSLITDSQIKELSSTRVKLNIQFPFANKTEFRDSTGTGNYKEIEKAIKKVQDASISIGLNTVIQTPDLTKLMPVITFALENDLPLKLLPQIGLSGSDRFKDDVFPVLQMMSSERIDKGTGAIRYTLKSNNHKISVLYIDSPCFTKDIRRCKTYGEVRILPNMSLQPCILKRNGPTLALENGKEFVLNQFCELWKNFNRC